MKDQRHFPYPDQPTKAVLRKREFHPFVTQKPLCSGKRFSLRPDQTFVMALMGPGTPYKSLLLYHGLGVGKTCSAVQIVESNSGHKPCIVITPQSIKASFKNTVFKMNDLPMTKEGFVDVREHSRTSCNGMMYLEKHIWKKQTAAEVRSSVTTKVSRRYKFYGYEQFANAFQKVIDSIKANFANLTADEIKPEIQKILKEIYDDRIIIVDEAHNLRSSSIEAKAVFESLIQILSVCDNVRLILMTATPMYNTSEEIVDLLNLLLLNDRQKLIGPEIFDSKGVLRKSARDYLAKAVSGRVSFMRGEDPTTFPDQLYAVGVGIGKLVEPASQDLLGKAIPVSQRMPTTKLHFTVLSEMQRNSYSRAKNDFSVSFKEVTELQQHSNITFSNSLTGEEGFKSAFSIVRGTRFRVQYRSERVLAPQNIGRYSAKFKDIVDSVKLCQGKVFIFSRFKWAGVLPLAIALEEAGLVPFKGKSILVNAKPELGAGKYSIITADDSLMENIGSIQSVVNAFNRPDSGLKVVLGTLKASEGLDFKAVREVHVLEPWYHFSIIDQVIGRAVRFCSHNELPPEKRNVTVFLHCACFSFSRKRRETYNEYMYRKSFTKQRDIGIITRILKQNAIDCPVLRDSLYIPSSGSKTIISSRAETVKINTGDQDGSSICDFQKCEYPCAATPHAKLDFSTVDPFVMRHTVDMLAWDVLDIMDQHRVLDWNQLHDLLNHPDNLILAYTLESLINPVTSRRWMRDNALVYSFNKYFYLPVSMINSSFTMADVRAQETVIPKVTVDIFSTSETL